MNRTLPKLRRMLLLCGVLLLNSGVLLAQELTAKLDENAMRKNAKFLQHQEGVKSKSLVYILEDLEKRFQVNFAYESALIEGVVLDVAKFDLEKKSLEENLNQLPSNLTWHKVSSTVYAIFKKDDKKQQKKLSDLSEQLESQLHNLRFDQLPTATEMQTNKVDVVVSGTVTSSDDGTPMPGVNVVLKGTNIGTTTDTEGKYTLSLPDANGTLIFSFIGFLSQEVQVGQQTTINIALAADITQLGEVVVVGYGEVKKKDLTGAVGIVDLKEASKVATAVSPLQALQGRVAGVDVGIAGGEPGADPVIRIRGVGTINNNNPLLVVDGIFTDGNLNELNPNDIESIQVLKDASAAAIYGSRGANGVIVVTTKQGKAGKTKFNFNSYYGFATPTNLYDLLSSEEYVSLNNAARRAANLNPLTTNVPVSEGGTYDPTINTNWQDEVYGTPRPQQKHDFSASGGSESGSYFLSLGYLNQEGTMINTGFEQYNARINSNFSKGIFKFGQTFNLARYFRKNDSGGNRPLVVEALRMPPTVPVTDAENLGGYAGPEAGHGVTVSNPIGTQMLRENTSDGVNLLGGLYGEINILRNLTYKANLGIDAGFSHSKYFIPEYEMGTVDVRDQNELSEGRGTSFTWLLEHTLNFNQQFGNHNVGALLGYSTQESSSTEMSLAVLDLPTSLRQPGAAAAFNRPNGTLNENSLLSYFGRLTYGFRDKYLLTLNVRTDGSSRFIEGNRWGTFPSASAAWRISEEAFFSPARNIVDDLKLRLSYGSLGNQNIGNYSYSSVLNLNPGYPLGAPTDADADGVPDRGMSTLDALTRGYAITAYAIPEITWETTTTKDIGVDATFLDGKIGITVDYWTRLTDNMLTAIPIPRSVGLYESRPTVNIGSIENKGLEVSASYRKTSGDFKFEISANVSTVKNEVLNLTGREDDAGIQGGGIESGIFNTTITKVGSEVGAFHLYDVIGIYQDSSQLAAYPSKQRKAGIGDLIIRDVNGDSLLDLRDRIYMGSGIPKLFGGLNFSASYKGFDASIFFQGVSGNKVFDALKYWTESGVGNFNYSRRMLDAWTPENRDTDIPRLVFGDPAQNGRLPTNRWLEDGSFVRLKNVQVGYTLPSTIMNKVSSGASLRIYFSGFNLLTFTNYTGYDPEILRTGGSGDRDRGVDRGNYPMTKTYVAGLQFSF